MPRRYYRRRTVVVRPKKKWASNIVVRSFTVVTNGGQGSAIPFVPLVSNSTQSTSPTPVVLKCGNFKLNVDLRYGTVGSSTQTGSYHLVAFVVFLPEGIAPVNNTQMDALIKAHPEYIMAWKQLEAGAIGSAAAVAQDKVVFSSRLKRNLNSGDQVVLTVVDETPNSNISEINVSFTCQYWTCSN